MNNATVRISRSTISRGTWFPRENYLIPSSGTGTVGTNYGETDFRLRCPGAAEPRRRPRRDDHPHGLDDAAVGRLGLGRNQRHRRDRLRPDRRRGRRQQHGDGHRQRVRRRQRRRRRQPHAGDAVRLGTTGDTRVTGFGYDFRDRQISMTGEIDVYAAYTFDNLGRRTQIDRYDTSARRQPDRPKPDDLR